MDQTTPQAYIDNARAKLSALLDKLCALEESTQRQSVESISQVATTLHFLCAPTYPPSNYAAPEKAPVTGVGETSSASGASAVDKEPAKPNTIGGDVLARVMAGDLCNCHACKSVRRLAAVNVAKFPEVRLSDVFATVSAILDQSLAAQIAQRADKAMRDAT